MHHLFVTKFYFAKHVMDRFTEVPEFNYITTCFLPKIFCTTYGSLSCLI